MAFVIEHTFLSFGCLHTATTGDFATEAEARVERDEMERQYQEWRVKPGNAGPVPSTFIVVKRGAHVPADVDG